MTLKPSRGLFLDLDGTLADSRGVLRQVYQDFLDHFGRPATDLEFDQLNGLTLPEVIRVLHKNHGLSGTEAILLELYHRHIDEVFEQVEPMPGALDLVRQAQALNWTLAVVTANSHARTLGWLERCGLLSHIGYIISEEQALRGKPWPDLYLAALEKSGCSVEQSMAVEDSPNGIRAARAAGLRTIAVGNPAADETDSIHNLSELIPYLR